MLIGWRIVSGFWKTWNSKVNKKSVGLPKTVDDISDQSAVAALFGTYFAENCSPSNTSTCNDSSEKGTLLHNLRSKLCERLDAYCNVTVELVDKNDIVSEMKRGL